ncbi:MAG: DUF5723 family protein [Bacteroidales bacterium]|nr:DUF5723 family protein [Bacteroidales bacterium]
MKKIILYIALFLSAGTLLHGQVYQQGFFLKDYRPIYRINPALFPDSDFIGGFELTRNKVLNYGVSTFYYPTDDGLVSGLNESVSADQFLSRVPDIVARQGEVGLNLFSYGIRRGNGYHSFEIGFRLPTTISAPKGIFELLKRGTVENQYNLSDLGVQYKAYVELSYGYGYKLSDIVSIGGRAKVLLALHGMSYRFTELDVQKSDAGYTIYSRAELDLPSRFYKIDGFPDQDINLSDIHSSYKFPRPTGGGAAFDLGVAVTPNEYLTLSASILDLGALAMHYGNAAVSTGYQYFNGLDLSYDDLNKNGLTNKALEIGKKFLDGLRPRLRYNKWRFEPLPFTANLGIRYTLPNFDQLRIGAIAQYTNYKYSPYWETRLGADYTPFKWLDLTASFGRGTYGFLYGFGISVHVSRFQVYYGLETGTCGTQKETTSLIDPTHRTWSIGLTYDL